MSRLLGIFRRILLLVAFVTLGAPAAWSGQITPATGAAFNVIYAIPSSPYLGSPSGAPVLDSNGNIYATTAYGKQKGCGTVFMLSKPLPPNGQRTFKIIYEFKGVLVDGCYPSAPLAIAGNVIYGTTRQGFGEPGNPYGSGEVFSLTPSGSAWTYKVVHVFNSIQGAQPNGVLVARDGTLYGTTYSGGKYGFGVLYTISTAGVFSVLHDFGDVAIDGGNPYGELVEGPGGTLYGATVARKQQQPYRYCGTVFAYSPAAASYAIIHEFLCGRSVESHAGRLVMDPNGVIFGTGESPEYIWSLTRTRGGPWAFTKILTSLPLQYPIGLIRDVDNQLYGIDNYLFLYRLTPPTTGTTWTLTRLYVFHYNQCDRTGPVQDLTISEGVIYGLTEGQNSCLGGVFSYKTYLAPPAASPGAPSK